MLIIRTKKQYNKFIRDTENICYVDARTGALEVKLKKNGSVKQIQEYTKNHFGYYAKTCWIADVKSQCGIYVKPAWNRKDKYNREVPCPQNKINDIREALNFFSLI